MELDKLKPVKGSRKETKRLGRGNASGTGKTAGKGHKGQKARSGGRVRPGFEGGQMPLYRRLPKFGFYSQKQISGKNQFNVINLDLLQRHFETGAVVDHEALCVKGLADRTALRGGVKLLGKGELKVKLTVKVQACSERAKQAVEAAGGSVEIVK